MRQRASDSEKGATAIADTKLFTWRSITSRLPSTVIVFRLPFGSGAAVSSAASAAARAVSRETYGDGGRAPHSLAFRHLSLPDLNSAWSSPSGAYIGNLRQGGQGECRLPAGRVHRVENGAS